MTTKHEALAFFEQHKLAVLSTVSAQGQPDGAAIYYTVKDDRDVYFLTHKESSKFKNIEANAAASLTVFNEDTQQTIQAQGKITEIGIGQEHDEALRMLAQLENEESVWKPPVSKIQSGEITLCRFTISRMRYSDFRSVKPHSGAHIVDVF